MTTLIAVLDKKHPPNHSFIDGMLSNVLPKSDMKVVLITSRNNKKFKGKIVVGKYKKAIFISKLFQRSGLKRLLNVFILAALLKTLLKKNYIEKPILLIRNEPAYLIVTSILRIRFKKIIFQQSFPHEMVSNRIKSSFAKLIFRLHKKYIDDIIGVSELSLDRLRNIFGNEKK